MDKTAPIRAFLVVVMALGCAALWIGLPAGCMWAAGQITATPAAHFLVALPSVLISMVLFARGLFWVNRLYVRVTFGRAAVEAHEDDEWSPRWVRGPLEPLLVGTLALAIVAMCVWFFVFAENPGRGVL